MQDELDDVIREARPRTPHASAEVIDAARRRAYAAMPEPRFRPKRRERLRRPVLAITVAAAIGSAFTAGLLVAPSAGKTAGKVAIESIGPNYGVSLELPTGWSGRVYNEQPVASAPAAYVQAGSFQLPTNDDDVGTAAAAAMKPNDVFIVLLESLGDGGFDYTPLVGTPVITRTDFGPLTAGIPPDHALARIFFSTAGRRFVISAQFGSRSVSDQQLTRVNDVLSTLRIQPRP